MPPGSEDASAAGAALPVEPVSFSSSAMFSSFTVAVTLRPSIVSSERTGAIFVIVSALASTRRSPNSRRGASPRRLAIVSPRIS